MKRPTKEEVAQEIADLKALKPIGPFAAKTARTISALVETLEHGFDENSDEWDELGDELQDAVIGAKGWKEGMMKDKPSDGWEGLAE